MGPLLALYHCKYEKSALPPSPIRTVFLIPPTKSYAAGGWLWSVLTPRCSGGACRHRQRIRLLRMLHATLSPLRSTAMSPSPFGAHLFDTRRLSAAPRSLP